MIQYFGCVVIPYIISVCICKKKEFLIISGEDDFVEVVRTASSRPVQEYLLSRGDKTKHLL